MIVWYNCTRGGIMKLTVSKSKNSVHFYASKSVIINGKSTTKTVKKIGTLEEVKEKCGDMDPYEWARQYVKNLTDKEKENQAGASIWFSGKRKIEKGQRRSVNIGYLFLQDIYYDLKLDKICEAIAKKYKFTFDLNEILSRLVYSRIIYPGSKKSTWETAGKFLEKSSFKLQHMYRALSILAKENDYLQSKIYDNSKKIFTRQDRILYYDCTNYYFEIEREDKFRKYGYSKEHKPNPIIQMGLFMDSNGVPLAFSVFPGNENEQPSMIPLEKKLLNDFEIDKMVVCTDAGLGSTENRKFNDRLCRSFITVQSVKKLKEFLQDFALSSNDWHLPDDENIYNLDEIESLDEESFKTYYDKVFFKERWINEDNLEQRLIVTFSFKYRDYLRNIRSAQVERAQKLIDSGKKATSAKPNDPKRFIDEKHCTNEGELAEKSKLSLNTKRISEEEIFDGFYAVCTNLSDPTSTIININKKRWEIEECFRIMKHECKARPVYLSREDRITAHFITCFIALIIYRILEKKLDSKFTCDSIIDSLRDMNMFVVPGDGYIPTYTRSDLTDALHKAFGFHTDYEIISQRNMGKILTKTKT